MDAAEVAGAPSTDIVGNLNLFQEFAGNLAAADFAGISLDSLTALYQRRQEIPQILEACNAINLLAFDQEAVSGIHPNSLQNIKECEPLIERMARAFEPDIPFSRLKVIDVKAQKHELQAVIDSFKELQAAMTSLKIWSA